MLEVFFYTFVYALEIAVSPISLKNVPIRGLGVVIDSEKATIVGLKVNCLCLVAVFSINREAHLFEILNYFNSPFFLAGESYAQLHRQYVVATRRFRTTTRRNRRQ